MSAFRLLSHVNADGDLLEAWLAHHRSLGVASFHIVAHGSRAENEALFRLAKTWPIVIEDEYAGPFHSVEKRDRLNRVLRRLATGWVVLLDSDEFLELPYRSLRSTARVMSWLAADALPAPMLQRIAEGGRLDLPLEGDPFTSYPWCSAELYAQIGQPQAATSKYPLFWLGPATSLREGGNHHPPNGDGSAIASLRGVTHHFKWRAAVHARLSARADSEHPYRHESVQYRRYLGEAGTLPLEGAFRYSRRELFARGLLERAPLAAFVRRRASAKPAPPTATRRHLPPAERLAADVRAARHASVVICGAGSGGHMFVRALAQQGVKVTHVADRNPALWGTTFDGAPVCKLEDAIAAGARVFVAGSLTYAAEIASGTATACLAQGIHGSVFSVAGPAVEI